MFDEKVIHDIAMLALAKNDKRDPITLAKLYKQFYEATKNELNSNEDEEEMPSPVSNRG